MQIIIGVAIIALIAVGIAIFQSREATVVEEPEASEVETVRLEDVPVETEPEPITTSSPTPEPEDETEPEIEVDDVAEAEEEEDFDPVDDQRVFSASASYFTPRRTEHDILVTLTLKDRVVVDADVTYDGGAAATPSHTRFDDAYRSEVIGKRLNEISLSRTGGASLTSDSFNEALADIKSQAS
ncbi:MAG: hypothetical protein AAGA35_03240 [Patescibacteria group bacterium]